MELLLTYMVAKTYPISKQKLKYIRVYKWCLKQNFVLSPQFISRDLAIKQNISKTMIMLVLGKKVPVYTSISIILYETGILLYEALGQYHCH